MDGCTRVLGYLGTLCNSRGVKGKEEYEEEEYEEEEEEEEE